MSTRNGYSFKRFRSCQNGFSGASFGRPLHLVKSHSVLAVRGNRGCCDQTYLLAAVATNKRVAPDSCPRTPRSMKWTTVASARKQGCSRQQTSRPSETRPAPKGGKVSRVVTADLVTFETHAARLRWNATATPIADTGVLPPLQGGSAPPCSDSSVRSEVGQ